MPVADPDPATNAPSRSRAEAEPSAGGADALGPREAWPPWLRWAVDTVRGSAAPMGLLVGDGAVPVVNAALASLIGLDGAGRDALAWGPAPNERRRVMAGETVTGALATTDRRVSVSHSPVRDETGAPRAVLSVLAPATAPGETVARGRESIPLADFQHRMRNALALIRSIARRTADASPSLDHYLTHFDGRLNALARVQSMLTSRPEGLTVEEIAAEELISQGAREGENAALEGPGGLTLAPKAAEVVGLAIHELATNAVKFGALGDGGDVRVQWSALPDGGARIEWHERFAPPAARRGERGFGAEVIEDMLAYEIDAHVRLEIGAGDILCRIDVPASFLIASPHAAAAG